MKKYLGLLMMLLATLVLPQVVNGEATVLPQDPILNVRIVKDLKESNDVKLNNLDKLSSRLYTIEDNDKNLYFCLDESKYYPSGHNYTVDPKEKISGNVLWLLNTFYQNQGKKNSVSGVPEYRLANELTRYAAIQIVIWQYSGSDISKELIDSNPLVKSLSKEASKQSFDDVSYQDMLKKLESLNLTSTEVTAVNSQDSQFYQYHIQVQDNMTADMEKLFRVEDENTKVEVSLFKNNKNKNITDQAIIEKNYSKRTVEVKVPKELIDKDKSDDTTLIFKMQVTITTRNPYYLTFISGGVQPLAGYQPVKKRLEARNSIYLKNDTTAFSILKKWNDGSNQDGIRPKQLEVQLYQSDQPYTYLNNTVTTKGKEQAVGDVQILSDAKGWEYTWSNLPKKDTSGKTLYYTAREKKSAGYDLSIETSNAGNTLVLTNTHKPETINLSGQKKWDDGNNQDGVRPRFIVVNLLADGEKIQKKIVTSVNNWRYEFTNLPKNKNGKPILYTVNENALPDYTTTVDGTTIINTRILEKTAISGKKTWDDANNQDGKRPSEITVNLLANGTKVQSKVVTEKDNWLYEFTDLPKNQNGKEITYTVTEDDVLDYSTTINGTNITNSYTPGKNSVTVTKSWNDENNQDGLRPNNIHVQLYADGKKQGTPVELNTANNWTYTWQNLAEKESGKLIVYTVKEVETIPGYTISVNNENAGNVVITNTHTPVKTAISGKKTWDDANNQDGKRPSKITVNLLADGTKISSKVVTEKDNWTYQFTDLPKYQNGKEITYTVTEDDVPEYSTTINGTNIKNSYTPGKNSVTVTKSWNDENNQDGLRPNNIHVQLYANGEKLGVPVELNAANQWTYTWQDLAEREAGNLIVYTVKEVESIPGYTISVDNEDVGSIVIVNAHTPEKTAISGKKTWDDKNNQDGKRPSEITVNLLADGTKVSSKVVTEKDNWSYQFTNLPKYQNGKAIVYTVTEDTVPEYSTTINGTNITNSYTPGITSVTVTKAWQDSNNQDGLRPNKIQVQLYANGKKKGTSVELNAANNWTYTWQNLAEKESGKLIVYTIKEVTGATELPGYSIHVNNDNAGSIVITNTHNPVKTAISGKKIWDDKNNQDGKRPSEITINLLADGVKVSSKVVTEKDNWSYQFSNLPKYQNGKEIIYTVTEDTVPDYSTTINGTNITNSYTPGITSVTVTKAWNDANNQDGLRPNKIQVQLYANGKKQGTPVELNTANNWTYTWQNLTEKESGQLIVYTIKEVTGATELPGYSIHVNNDNAGSIVITNTHTPENTAISGKKTWDDKNNQDGKRPSEITVNLLADGVKVSSKVVTEKDNWSYQFTNLPKYQNGKAIVYTVTEDDVLDYSTTINGTNITNSYTPGITSVTVTKAWNDANNQDGLRPNKIQVQLYANGKKQGTPVELNTANNWTYTWQNLAEKESGQLIVYTIKEVTGATELPGYSIHVNNDNAGSIVITNTHNPVKTAISGKKTWDDKNNQDGKRPSEITINLLADGVKVSSKVVTEKDNWSYQFSNLPKYQNGKEVVYTVTEDRIPNYSTTINGNNITNRYTPGKTSVTVTKAWNDANNQDGLRPNKIQVQLYANGKKQGTPVELNTANNWTYTWQNLAEKEAGNSIVYTVQEVSAIQGYTISVDNENIGNIVITNTHTPVKTAVSGTKTWDDANNQDGKRPSEITVNLLANGVKVSSKVVTEKDNWTYQFTDLPKYQNGKEIVYTVTENRIPNYSTTINGNNITNRYTPGKTSVTVTKAWNDANNQDGLRPNKIQVQLYANGNKQGKPVELSAANNWTYTWQELAEKESGKAIVYTIEEVDTPKGYTVSSNQDNQGNIMITNTHTPEVPKVPDVPKDTPKIPNTGATSGKMIRIFGVLILFLVLVYVRKRQIDHK